VWGTSAVAGFYCRSGFEIAVSLWHTGTVDRLDFGSVLLIAIGLSADCFAVALGASTSAKGISRLQMLRVSLAFGAAQAMMPVLGWLGGKTLVNLISDYDHWVSFGLLLVIGSRMIWESFHSKEDEAKDRDISKGLPLLILAVATSIDALAVGVSFAFLSANIVMAVLTIGVVCFLVTGVGFLAGRKAGQVLGERAETVGGIILIGIGLRILLTHLL
jgi:putative Mn2+ efflux pump MntP